MNGVVVFVPSPLLTITIENHGTQPDIHLHAGGQGVWQSRMLVTLGSQVTMCAVLGGETGHVLRPLLEAEGLTVRYVEGSGRNGSYVHDRRRDTREVVAEALAMPLARHELDQLYDMTLSASLDASAVILSGPAGDDTIPAGIYRRLAADLRATGRMVVVDLSGERLAAALQAGVDVLKVSDDELMADGRLTRSDTGAIIEAMYHLHEEGASRVVVSRAAEPALALDRGEVVEITVPRLQAADTHGAGDSFTAGVTVALTRGASFHDALRLGAAAGAVNVTRHGLGSGDVESILKVRDLVEIAPWPREHTGTRLSPQELARRAQGE
ncbi:phosphofructokinase [Phytoactinopolyspora alkaliphila]|uniref:Phosphofructokinase n=1 Tax=Phytoactinopolyspora alkaliphila TaxID=1783498 RepID=A0A6N9YIS0_9ACTN|nr:PfkB family carbohydrate kinase [Phytoactinopolyspora alkaliphila]NED94941.1 phosphofructokinase [Phytoactinopolyspora alkaliphila]